MREECRTESFGTRRVRITPAHAGRIAPVSYYTGFFTDHPRACGKNSGAEAVKSSPVGSPPRMREESFESAAYTARYRITPAHAGRIPCCLLQGRLSAGSPPRMREESLCGACVPAPPWITPAHAGRMLR